MNFEDLLTKAFERTNALQTYWTLDATVLLALVAFFSKIETTRELVVGNIKVDHVILLAVLTTIAFAAFVVANLSALRDVSRQRAVIQKLLEIAVDATEDPSQQEQRRMLAATLNPATIKHVTVLHVAGDLFAITAIWFLAGIAAYGN